MRPFGIDVSLVQLGFIHSESFKNVRYTERGLSSISGSQLKWQTTYPYFFNICEDGRSKYGNVVAEPFWGIEIQGDLMKIDMGEFTFHGEYCESGDQVYFNFKRNLLPINY
jgi:hypothetical protein